VERPRYFYHSFPRPRARENAIDRGLMILECLTRVGLVLAPEIVEWNQPLSDGTIRTHHTVQQRICFTEISARELRAHADNFGPFALEWEISALRRLGAIPVFYIPQTLSENPGLSATGISLVVQMFDCQYTMVNLARLQAASRAASSAVVLQNTDDSGAVVHAYNVPVSDLRDILAFLGYRCAPFDMMLGILGGVSRLFYPTDNLVHDKLLDYYRQREWRLIGFMSKDGQPVSRKTEGNEGEYIRQTSPEFWGREIAGGQHRFRRASEALVYPQFDGRHVLTTVRRVIVPHAAVKRTKQILSGAGLNIPVASRLWTCMG
jgi:hypothetical protein